MRNIIRIIPIIAAILCVTACNKPEGTANESNGHTIIYTINHQESQVTLKSDAEWDALLERFCDYAEEGNSVLFYGMASQFRTSASSKDNNNGTTTFTTDNREEIKAWMRRMEQAGKTVNVVYNRETGIWKGTAYIHSPATMDETPYYCGVLTMVNMPEMGDIPIPGLLLALRINSDTTLIIVKDNMLLSSPETLGNYHIGDTISLTGTIYTIEDNHGTPVLMLDITVTDAASFVGTWIYSTLTEYVKGNGGDYLLVTTTRFFDEDDDLTYYPFQDNGTATRTIGSTDANATTGNWSLSTDGIFVCDLFDVAETRWNVNWLTTSSMIISSTKESDTIYVISLKKN